MIPHGRASWPGIREGEIESAEYTCSHGIAASVATITTHINATPSGQGTLVINDGAGLVALPGCKVDKATVSFTDAGPRLIIFIFDRRWKWYHGSIISGTYNVRDDNDEILEHTRRSAAQLAAAILLQMGELNAEVIGVPGDQYPAVEWEDANCAEALQDLITPYDCRVVYQPFPNRVLIAPAGVGAGLPDRPMQSSTPSLDFPEKPDAILVSGGPVRYEVLLQLEAVGLDVDGVIRPIDELSYKPKHADGWGYGAPPNFANIPRFELSSDDNMVGSRETQHQKILNLAQTTVFKWYRVKMNVDHNGEPGDIILPLFGKITRRDQLILEPTRLLQKEQLDGTMAEMPAEVYGIVRRDKQTSAGSGTASPFGNTSGGEKITGGFQVDSQRGLVIFEDFMFRRLENAAGEAIIAPADFRILCAVQVRHETTSELSRFKFILTDDPSGVIGSGAAVIKRPEIVLRVRQVYKVKFPANPALAHLYDFNYVVTNEAECREVALDWATHFAASFQYETAAEITYPGIVGIMPDGAIQQVTWRVGGGVPPATTASRNSEHAYWQPSYQAVQQKRRLRTPLETNAPPPVNLKTALSQKARHVKVAGLD